MAMSRRSSVRDAAGGHQPDVEGAVVCAAEASLHTAAQRGKRTRCLGDKVQLRYPRLVQEEGSQCSLDRDSPFAFWVEDSLAIALRPAVTIAYGSFFAPD